MANSARSFEARTDRPDRVVSAVLQQARRPTPGGVGLLFLGGGLAAHAEEIVGALSQSDLPQSWLVSCARGVLTERGEIEQEPAAAGMVLGGVTAEVIVSENSSAAFGTELGDRLRSRPGASALVFSGSPPDSDSWPFELAERLEGGVTRVFGAGTLPRTPVWWLPRAAREKRGETIALILEGAAQPRIFSSSAARLLSPLSRVSRVRGSMVLELEGSSALSLLSESAQNLDGQPLILLAVASGDRPLSVEGRTLGLRPILGVDPTLGGVLLADELPLGTRVAFAVRDAHAARADMKAHLGSVARGSAGSAPQFGFFANCAGRGRGLYGSPDVDVRLIREQFPEMPLLGLHSTFELAPESGALSRQIYTGVLGIFCRPS